MLGLYPVFQPPLEHVSFNCDGVHLLIECDALDQIARSAGCTELSDFADNRPVPEGIEGGPDEIKVALGERTDWYSSADGLSTVESLLVAIQNGKNEILENPDAVVGELTALRDCLLHASQLQAKFRIEVSYS